MSVGETARWVLYARSDLEAARVLMADGSGHYRRQVCFLAQQCAEKALKAVLISCRRPFPYAHDLDRLRDLIPSGWRVKAEFPDLAELTIWAVEARYPGETPEVTADEARDALQLAERVLLAVERDLRTGSVEAP